MRKKRKPAIPKRFSQDVALRSEGGGAVEGMAVTLVSHSNAWLSPVIPPLRYATDP